jgi:hypothetical protein
MPDARARIDAVRMLRDHLPHDRMGLSTAVAAVALAGAFSFAIVTPAKAIRSVSLDHQTTPQATVRDFLTSAVVDEDGGSACKYLTPNARISFERHTPAGPTCEAFFGNTQLALGGLDVQSDHDLARLTYSVVPDGAGRVVDVSHDGQSFAFRLVPATPTETQGFQPLLSSWRIDSSVAALGTPSPSIHSRV